MNKNKRNLALAFLGLILLIFPLHAAGIDKVVTFDEPWWVISGSNYYYALTHKDFANTIYDYHPAVTTTWIVTAGMLSYFPEYRGYGQGYFDVRKPQFENFLREHGKEAIDLVRNSRLIQTTLLTALALVSFTFLQLLLDQTVAFLAIVLAMNAPFFLGHSRLLNHEGMLAMFVLVSVLGMQVYINKERKLIYLLISGAAFGLAQLTKSSSIVVIPLVGLIMFVDLFKKDGKLWGNKIFEAVKSFGLWLVFAALIYVILWPGMWVAPGKMLYEIYGNAFSYAFQGARLDVTQEVQPAASSFDLAGGLAGSLQYISRWAATSTAVTWLGLISAFFIFFSKDEKVRSSLVRSTMLYLAILASLFILMFGVAHGRDSLHYILSSFVCLDVIAGLGWGYLLILAQKRWTNLSRTSIQMSAVAVVILLQIGSSLPFYPYYFTYHTPFKAATSYGYGEGLDQAAAYLSQKPNAKNTKVYVYAGMGSFSFFYPGETGVLKKVYLTEPGVPSILSGLKDSGYLVVYSAVQDRQPESVQFLQALKNVQPEIIFSVNGLESVRVYKVADIPESAYEEMKK